MFARVRHTGLWALTTFLAAASVAMAETFTATTTGQTVDAIERVALPSRQIDFSPNSMLMGYTLGGQTFGAVPPSLTLTSVTLYDLTDLGTGGTLGATSLPTVSLYGKQGTELLGTANRTGAGEPVLVRLADGSEVSLTPVTYTFVEKNLTLDGTATYRLTLNAAGVTSTLPLFTNAATAGDSGFNLTDVSGCAPFLAIMGEVTVTDVALRAEDEASLSALLGEASFTDDASRIVTVALAEGATLTLDRTIANATLVFEAEGAAAVTFASTVNMTCPFVFRNAAGVADGVITLSGPWEDVSANDGKQIWQPKSLAIDCDVNVDSPLPLIASGWFQQKSVRVLPGRTLRLTHEAATAERLPIVALTAPTANLAFAGEGLTGGLPAKYRDLFFGTSGTVTLERPVVFAPTGNENDSNGSVFRIGNQGDAGYNFTLNVDETFSSTPRLVLGGKSGSATLNLRGAEATTYAAVINFDTGSTLTQKAGALTLGNADWATKFVGDSATLIFGDGDIENGLATATLFGIPYGVTTGGVTTDYRGAADLTVKADATLLLNECDLPAVAGTPDYALYPVGKRSLKVQGGTVKANTGAAVTMVFENPEPQAAPMAVAEIPGLEVIGAANLESSDTTNSSLSLDALKGNGAVTLSGVVHIDSVRLGEGDTLTFDLRRGEGDVDDAIGGSRVTIDAVTGTAGTVRFGLLGTNGTTGEQTVIDTLLAGGFTGTVGFLVPDYTRLDFEDTQLPELPFTLEVQPGQTVVMRLDQYADADILWPEDCSNVTLVLVEAGPFGGEASLPAWPQDVMMEFHRYDDSSEGHSALPGEDYDATRNDDGLTIDLTWKDPVLTGKVAWVDIEFNGNSYNTGWFRLKGPNGEATDFYNAMFDGTEYNLEHVGSYTETYNPDGYGANPRKQPYIPVTALENYPDSWSIVARVTAAEFTKSVMLAIGASYKDVTGGTGDDFSDRDTLVLATGKMKNHGSGTTGSTEDSNDLLEDTIRLWLIRGRDLYDAKLPETYLAQAELPQITERPHLYTITYDNRHIQVYVDGHCLMDETLPEDINLGPGLQVGKLMGGANIDSDHLAVGGELAEQFKPVTSSSGDGVVDFIRIYRGVLSDMAIDHLVRANPYIQTDPGSDSGRHQDIRYRRVLARGEVGTWVDPVNKPWIREHKLYDDESNKWWANGNYAEPAEGTIVVVEVPDGEATLIVNTQKEGLFPSADRAYSTLIVSGRDAMAGTPGIDRTTTGGWRGGTLILAPYGYVAQDQPIDPEKWEEPQSENETNGVFKYGTLRFTGGAGNELNRQEITGLYFFGRQHTRSKAAYFLTNTQFYASVVDFNSKDGVALDQNVDVRAIVEESMLRGFNGEKMVRQITGPVFECDNGYGAWDRRDSDTMSHYTKQRSDYVWPDLFYEDRSAWLFSDATLEHNPGLELYNAPQVGLFVEAMKIPGRLYLELNEDSIQGNGELSQQEWYRYGYNGDSESETMSGYAPLKALEGDFEKAVALSIRLKNGEEKTLLADSVADGLTINELTIDKPKADDGTANETLRILPQAGTDNSLKVLEAISTDRRLEVYSAQGTGSEASATGADGVKLHAVYDEATETNIGAKLYGIETGAFVAGNSSINHALDGSSIARIESVGTIRFTAAQELSATTLAAAEEAIVEQVGAANGFVAKAMELAQGSRFRFASSAATVDEGITFLGAAMLEGTGTAATLTPNAGLVAGEVESAKAILDAKESASWKLLNREVGGLPLTKVGAGVADIATDLPPNAGFVDVQEGTLRVATGLAGEGQAVGQASLNVAEGAMLAPTSGTIADDVLAEIPAGQTVSGLGRIDGILRLEQDATLDATTVTDALSLSVGSVQTDGKEALADVAVALPEKTHEGLVFLRSDETTLNWAARARLLATAPTPTRWEVLLRYRPDPDAPAGSDYLVGVPGLDVPVFPDDEPQPGEGENAWPEGDDVAGEVTDQVQGGGQIAGGSEGFTQAATKRLTASDIANAYRCFKDVWALSPRTKDQTSEDYATVDLLMAYEFGISRMALVTDGGTEQVLVEVTLRNVLGSTPAFAGRDLQGVDTHKPSFADGVSFTLVGPEGTIFTATEIDAAKANALGFDTALSTQETARWFLIPYTEANFPAGKAMTIDVRVAKETAASDD